PGQQRIDQRIDVRGFAVDADRSARRGAHAEAAHQRLRAVVAGTYAHAAAVHQLGHVVRVDALEDERHQAAAAVRVWRTERAKARDLGAALEHVGGQPALVRACAPSMSETAPAARTRAVISATGLIVPSTFETCVKATKRTSPRASSASSASSESSPRSSTSR